MNDKFQRLVDEVEQLRRRLKTAEMNLRGKRAACVHQWDDPEGKYTPDVRKAYRTRGDEPGTMGVDWQGPVNVPKKETPKWVRTCRICGFQQTTTRTAEKVSQQPVF
jgi:hypothetical protein